ncbi:MAG: UMP kinase [Bacteroidales bacterium]|nr:UMP kinase [Bacteroidales bacterium]MBN2762100.1 UMP kinase [Bacteroidales bacterium]
MPFLYNRILLKLSGEALMGVKNYGFDEKLLIGYASQIKELQDSGVQVGIVVGGGNIFRGVSGIEAGFDRVSGDYMGMLATVINGLALQTFIRHAGGKARVLTAVEMLPVAERYTKTLTAHLLDQGYAVIFTFGTGNPFFTTDTAAALRGVEMNAEVLLKGTRVDGVYTADPEKDKTAVKFDEITFDEAYKRGLKIMDMTAFTMCKENNLPVIVFDMNKEGNLMKIIQGEKVGTLVKR